MRREPRDVENRTILTYPPGRAPTPVSGRRRLPEKRVENPGCRTIPAPPFPGTAAGALAKAFTAAFRKLDDVAVLTGPSLPAPRGGGATAATSMAGMTGTGPGAPGGALGALVRIGPWLMLTSVALMTAAFTLTRRPVTALPALLAGAVLYAGMYAQRSLPVMYASIAVGYLAWTALALWAARGSASAIPWHRRPRRRPGERPGLDHEEV